MYPHCDRYPGGQWHATAEVEILWRKGGYGVVHSLIYHRVIVMSQHTKFGGRDMIRQRLHHLIEQFLVLCHQPIMFILLLHDEFFFSGSVLRFKKRKIRSSSRRIEENSSYSDSSRSGPKLLPTTSATFGSNTSSPKTAWCSLSLRSLFQHQLASQHRGHQSGAAPVPLHY